MARRQPRIYMPQFRQQMVELVRLGRKYEDLGPEFGCTLVVDPAAVKRAERDELASYVARIASPSWSGIWCATQGRLSADSTNRRRRACMLLLLGYEAAVEIGFRSHLPC